MKIQHQSIIFFCFPPAFISFVTTFEGWRRIITNENEKKNALPLDSFSYIISFTRTKFYVELWLRG